jgi:hypothetical protein
MLVEAARADYPEIAFELADAASLPSAIKASTALSPSCHCRTPMT